MPYCFKCGVEVNNGVKKCPLCMLDLPVFEDEKIIEPRYPTQENVFREIKKRRRNVFFAIYSMIVIAILVNLIVIDWRQDSLYTWSRLTTIYLLGSLVYMVAVLQYSKNMKFNFSLIGVNTLVILCLNDILDGKLDWFLQLGLPITILSTITAYYVFVIFSRKKLLPYKIMETITIGGIFLIALELIINKFMFERFYLSWSMQTLVCLLPLMAILVFMPRRLYEKIDSYVERKLHM